MAAVTENDGVMRAADGTPLKQALARATRMNKMRAFLLTTPLLAFILVSFILPIGLMLFRSISAPEVAEAFPKTLEVLKQWDGEGVPGEDIYATLAAEMSDRDNRFNLGKAGTRLNYMESGFRSLMNKTTRRIKRAEAPFKDAFIKIDKRWGEADTWKTIRQAGSPYTIRAYLNAIDLTQEPSGDIVAQPEVKQIYVTLFERTIWVSIGVTVACIALAYPISYLLATLPAGTANLLMIFVLLPFWTSLLVRTTSWIVLLQTNGVINDILVWIGIVGDDNRIQMIYNMTGTFIAMTHILLPFMVLPLYSVMKTIPKDHMRAARSLGANPAIAFMRIYMPQTVPGVGAGSILVFILAIGYYITPALVGGQDGQLISNIIEYHMKKSLNWSLAAALGGILLAGVLALYWLYNRIVGISNMKLG
ncbi:ABC transporter permease [Nisaea acidiphila]|uniref:ABC transporter permease n=1 Tax=Nisaea acidiphila TaxID=1862145 RepID=A0A9J7AYI9_9PROT|nr:ABC transporter permease [Nisaea acidiphila]UUX51497.1 ABC transporter permease [Nisaea acidiphila]